MFANTKGLFWLLNSNDTRSSSTSNQAQEHCIVWAQVISLKLQVGRVLWASWVEFNLLHRWRNSKCPFMICKNTRSLQRWGNRIRFGANNFWPNQLLSNLPNLVVYSCPMVEVSQLGLRRQVEDLGSALVWPAASFPTSIHYLGRMIHSLLVRDQVKISFEMIFFETLKLP